MAVIGAPAEHPSAPETDALRGRVLEALRDAGAVATGIAGVDVLDRARRTIEGRRDVGLHDQMAFTFRNPARSSDPCRALPSARSAVVVAVAYESERGPAPGPLMAEVARYAASDTYQELRRTLRAGVQVLRDEGHRGVVVADDNALVDRAMAERAGLGWTGKNTNLLVPGVGSWVVLGSILTDVELEPAPVENRSEITRGCGGCTRCLEACPTDALVAPGVMDASRCLSWLLQRTGSFPREFRVALGVRIYGCDDCQEVCPPSRPPRGSRDATARVEAPGDAHAGDAHAGDAHAGDADAGDANAGSAPAGAYVELSDLLTLDDESLLERFGAWYIPRRDPRYLRRNALVALGNAAAGSPAPGGTVRELLRRYLADEDPLLVQHAAWAARRSGQDRLLTEGPWATHPEVLAEVSRTHPTLEETLLAPAVDRETPVNGPGQR